jgi:O-antigen/teichoic acid export membrane protein
MIKQFFKNSTIYIIGNILVKGISLFLVPIYTRYLSPGEYGIIDLFSVIGSFISLTITYRNITSNSKILSRCKNIKREERIYFYCFFIHRFYVYYLFDN